MQLEDNFQPDSVVQTVVDAFLTRAKFGKAKYGVDLDRQDLDNLAWIKHAKEEAMDFILYLTKLEQELQK